MSLRRRMMNVPPKAKRYIYNAGDECVYLTGGWSNKGYNNNIGSFYKEQYSLKIITGLNLSWVSMSHSSPIDLSKYSSLNVEVDLYEKVPSSKGYFYISSQATSSEVSIEDSLGSDYLTLEISDGITTYPKTVSGIFKLDLEKVPKQWRAQAYISLSITQMYSWGGTQLTLKSAWLE